MNPEIFRYISPLSTSVLKTEEVLYKSPEWMNEWIALQQWKYIHKQRVFHSITQLSEIDYATFSKTQKATDVLEPSMLQYSLVINERTCDSAKRPLPLSQRNSTCSCTLCTAFSSQHSEKHISSRINWEITAMSRPIQFLQLARLSQIPRASPNIS